MKRYSDISERDIERLLAGQTPEGGADLQEVARFIAEVGAAYPETPTGHLEARHVAAMTEAAAFAPEERTETMTQRILAGVRTMLAPRWAKVAAVALASLLAFSGVAVAGVLPTPVQDAVAGVVAGVGIDLPDSAEPADIEDADEADEDAQDEDAVEADEDAQDEDADEADEDAQDEDAVEADEDAQDEDAVEADEDADTEQPEAGD